MLIIISPAKSMDMEADYPFSKSSQPLFVNEAKKLIEILKPYNENEIKELMGISSNLARLSIERILAWKPSFSPEYERPALVAFRGDVYSGMDPDSFTEGDYIEAQKKLRILSGLYGVLRPLDLIRPYRLEMGTKLKNDLGNDLYKFWGDKLTNFINDELQKSSSNLLINLASNEYFKALNKKKLKAEIVTPVFKDLKNGQYKIVSFWAKKARGMMTRFIIQNKIENVEDLRAFDSDGYYFNNELSKNNELIFTRDH